MGGEILQEEVVIGGIAGLATAVALKRVGVKALVLERANELRTIGAALRLLHNAWVALDSLCVSDKLTPIYSPVTKALVTNVSNGVTQQIKFVPQQNMKESWSVHRKALLEALAQELPDDSIRFSSKLISIETQLEGSKSIVYHR